jgi:hypothetical protein
VECYHLAERLPSSSSHAQVGAVFELARLHLQEIFRESGYPETCIAQSPVRAA